MPNRKCPHCGREGFVRYEHVITATFSARHFYCGACQRTWEEKVSDARSRPRPNGGRDRSGLRSTDDGEVVDAQAQRMRY
jgi:transposase-like protein